MPHGDPLSHLQTASTALMRILALQKQLFLVEAQERTVEQFRRVAIGVGAVLATQLALTLALFWITIALHERGWPAWSLALLSLVTCATPAWLLARIAISGGTRERNS